MNRVLHRYRFTLVFLLIGIVVVGVGWYVVSDLLRAKRQVQQMYTGAVQGIDLIGDLLYSTQETRRTMLYALTTDDPNLQIVYADQSHEAGESIDQLVTAERQYAKSPQLIEAIDTFERDWAHY